MVFSLGKHVRPISWIEKYQPMPENIKQTELTTVSNTIPKLSKASAVTK